MTRHNSNDANDAEDQDTKTKHRKITQECCNINV